MKDVRLKTLAFTLAVLVLSACAPAFAAPRHATPASLSANSRELFATAMQWGDEYYDAQYRLCVEPPAPASLRPIRIRAMCTA